MKLVAVSLLLCICYTISMKLEDHMRRLDHTIVRQLTTPTKKYRDIIIPNINTYNLNLYNVIKWFRQQLLNSTLLAMSVFNGGRPQFMTCRSEFNYSLIKQVLQWEDFHMYHLNSTVDTGERLWIDLTFWCCKSNVSSNFLV